MRVTCDTRRREWKERGSCLARSRVCVHSSRHFLVLQNTAIPHTGSCAHRESGERIRLCSLPSHTALVVSIKRTILNLWPFAHPSIEQTRHQTHRHPVIRKTWTSGRLSGNLCSRPSNSLPPPVTRPHDGDCHSEKVRRSCRMVSEVVFTSRTCCG